MKNTKCREFIMFLLLLLASGSAGTISNSQQYNYYNENVGGGLPGGAPPSLPQEEGTVWGEVTGLRGQSVRLKCPVEGEGNVYYRWWKDGVEIDSLWTWFRIQQNNGRTIKIKKLTDRTVGRYLCKATNGYGSEDFTFHVGFRGQTLFTPEVRVPVLADSLSNLTIYETSPLKLTCNLRSQEKLPLKWLKSGGAGLSGSGAQEGNVFRLDNMDFQVLEDPLSERMTITDGYRIQDNSYMYRLTILSAVPDDSGLYLCVVFLPGADQLAQAFQFRSAGVTVLPFSSSTSSSQSGRHHFSPLSTVLAVLLPVVFFLMLVAAVLIWKTRILHTKKTPSSQDAKLQPSLKPAEQVERFLPPNERNSSEHPSAAKNKQVSWVYKV